MFEVLIPSESKNISLMIIKWKGKNVEKGKLLREKCYLVVQIRICFASVSLTINYVGKFFFLSTRSYFLRIFVQASIIITDEKQKHVLHLGLYSNVLSIHFTR